MLEIRELTKVYDTKGVTVRALDGVSVRFPEKGMVFLLGKSGSGKSTLLNLCGGLDAPDSGEIIIKGRSSKDFSQSDFDSYRNTFIGFVFQEYNILNEFTVEDNIALALELQGKSKDRARVQEILRQVELEQFAKRKPNTLSGGQKQRVAIARALVKNPEIIMADEPTGALDSNTGKQVFDTLKKLSETKLVIVVSHDREFAEIYGDRIIELKDGKIISDVTKEKIQATRESDNLSFIGEDTISVQDGSRLTDADMGRIRTFLSKAKGKVLLSCGQKEISDFKKAARIDESGAREAFADTDEADIPSKTYTAADSAFIRSKLPMRHAVRIGASSLRVKPFRLFFTILLSFIAFTMFGLFSTLTFYDEKSVMLESYIQAEYDTVTLSKYYQYDSVSYERKTGEEIYRYTSSGSARFTPAEVREYRDRYGAALGLYNYSSYTSERFFIENLALNSMSDMGYYLPYVYNFADGAQDYAGLEFIAGESDLSAYGVNDVAISSYLFESFKQFGLNEVEGEDEYGNYRQGDELELNEAADIVGKRLLIQEGSRPVALTVRGVFRADLDEKYSALKEATGYGDIDYTLVNELQSLVSSGLYGAALVSDGFYEAHLQDFTSNSFDTSPDYIEFLDGQLSFQLSVPEYGESNTNSYIQTLVPYTQQSVQDTYYIYMFEEGKTTLADNEILIEEGDYFAVLNSIYNELWNEGYQQIWDETYYRVYQEYLEENWDDFLAEFKLNNSGLRDELYQKYIDQGCSDEEAAQNADADFEQYADIAFRAEGGPADSAAKDAANGSADKWSTDYQDSLNILSEAYRYSEAEVQAALDFLSPYFAEAYKEGKFLTEITIQNMMGNDVGTYTIVGFYDGEHGPVMFSESETEKLLDSYGQSTYYVEETNYVKSPDEKYNTVIFAMPDRAGLSSVINGADEVGADDTYYTLVSPVADSLGHVNSMIETLEQVFLWVGVVMALFSMLLLFNFISVSITNKKREIGILRAVGARSADVFKIFFSESVIIAAICFVLSLIAGFVVCGVLNDLLAPELGAAIFVFGPLSILVLLGIAAVTSFIATFLPVYSIAKKKPVESIRSL